MGNGTMTCEQISAIARDREPVSLAPAVAERLAAGHRAVQEMAAQGPVYGRSTGVGALLTARVLDSPESPDGAVDGLLRSHATTAGAPLPNEQVRAMTAVRLEQIAVGRSGLGPATAAALVELLNTDRMPAIGRFNSLGTGDVAPLARLALTLPPGALDAGDGLALMSSNALTIGRAALAVIELDRLLAAATVVTALTFLARDGAAGALHPSAAGPFRGPQHVARVLRALGAGSRRAARLQDQYGLRAAPQTLGIAVDAAATLRDVVTALTTSGLENPLVLIGQAASGVVGGGVVGSGVAGIGVTGSGAPEGGVVTGGAAGSGGAASTVIHHGGFHAVHLTAALDDAALALARAAVGSVNRLALLTEPPPDGEPDGEPGGDPTANPAATRTAALGRRRPDRAGSSLPAGPSPRPES